MDTLLQYGLHAVFLALILTPFGLPLPEDISLMVAGALASSGANSYLASLLVGYLGVTLGDSIAWFMGWRVGLHPTGWLRRMAGQSRFDRIERFYRRYGAWTIAICRQIPGMRFPAFFFAGATGVSYPRFIAFDGSAALITVNLFVFIGYSFADDLGRVVIYLDHFRDSIALGLGALLAVLLLRYAWQRLRRRREDTPG